MTEICTWENFGGHVGDHHVGDLGWRLRCHRYAKDFILSLLKLRTSYQITTKLYSHIFLVMFSTRIDLDEFGWIFWQMFFHVFGQKQKSNTSKGCWAKCVTSIFHITHDFDLGILGSNFEIAVPKELEGLTWNERVCESCAMWAPLCNLGLWPQPQFDIDLLDFQV